jgi:hypothetical protein
MKDRTALGIIVTLMLVIVGLAIGCFMLMSQASSMISKDDCQTVRTTVVYRDGEEVKTFDYLDCKE